MTRDEYLREIADSLDEAQRLQARMIELTERVYHAAGVAVADRAPRGLITGLLFGLLAHLETLNRLVRGETRAPSSILVCGHVRISNRNSRYGQRAMKSRT